MKSLKTNNYIIVIIIIFLILSCDRPFNFQRDKTLIDEYQYTARSDVILIYYNVTTVDNKSHLSLAVKNVSGNFLVDLTFSLHIEKPVKLTRFIDLGNIKNRSVKNIDLEVPADTKQVYIDYAYTPVNEDMFVQFDNRRTYGDYRRFSDTITLFLP